jgi:hypothetical protein
LKSHWLDGKCNWCIDHLVHTLVNSMEPDYQAWHRRQIVGLEGPNLIGQQCQEILASAKEISHDSIQSFDHTQFHVVSQSRSGPFYIVDLNNQSCRCIDFPRINFCKHIAAVYAHFPHLCPEEGGQILASDPPHLLDLPPSTSRSVDNWGILTPDTQALTALTSTFTSTISVLSDQSAPSQAVLDTVQGAVWLASYSTETAIASI